MKFRLRLDNEIDVLTRGELGDELDKTHGWQREAAFGVRDQELPRMVGTPAAGILNLGADQPDQTTCGPPQGTVWAVHRVSVDGLVANDAVKLYNQTKFVAWISFQPGFVTFTKGALTLKPGDYLRITGTALTTTAQVEVTGSAVSAPGPMRFKVLT